MWRSYLSAALVFIPAVLGSDHACFICRANGEENNLELEYQFPGIKPPVCIRGITPTAMACPPKYKGCVTQYRGVNMVKACGEVAIDSCNIVNRVEYCYCKGRLCNRKDKAISELTVFEKEKPSDDEDLEEGSGSEPPINPGQTQLRSSSSENLYQHSSSLIAILIFAL
ncbi:uncharacterized protein LOC106672508 isoform X2 [Cimex lectularius]|uniref:Uncharacterized protein n=1 Tax=Cimex lectularius TaxID=79782 RepID=A0A8I6SAB9_CIMLE|nr:uncharacterized protein LOC106672508 isoform X2 [Cimex lectularius]